MSYCTSKQGTLAFGYIDRISMSPSPCVTSFPLLGGGYIRPVKADTAATTARLAVTKSSYLPVFPQYDLPVGAVPLHTMVQVTVATDASTPMSRPWYYFWCDWKQKVARGVRGHPGMPMGFYYNTYL